LFFFVVSFAEPQVGWPDCSPTADAHFPNNGTAGPFGPVSNFTAVWQDHPVVTIYPTIGTQVKYPVVVFMHGSTGAIEMYWDNLQVWASHGFVVLFPYIKDPAGDRNPLTTNTNGEFLLKAVAFANFSSTENTSSPIYGLLDLSNVVLAGHSMGATCSIMAAQRTAAGEPRIARESVKLVVTQHPGICGPFGPPPWPSTWMESDLSEVVDAFPTLFTTATNDGAFWPAPLTAKHELGCWGGGVSQNGTHPAIFVQFSAAACDEDGAHPPWTDSGHDCPFKTAVESPWVITAMKLYAQQGGRMDSNCATMLYGNGKGSLKTDKHVEKLELRSNPLATTATAITILEQDLGPDKASLTKCLRLMDGTVDKATLIACASEIPDLAAAEDTCALKCSLEAIGVYWACAAVCIEKAAPDSCITAGCLAATTAFDVPCLKACNQTAMVHQVSKRR